MKTLLIGAFALACALPAAASAQTAGQWVLAPWQGSAELYPGVVQSVTRDHIVVAFDDGTSATMAVDAWTDFNWRRGTVVQCQGPNGEWYQATITMMGRDGSTMDVRFENDLTQRTNTGRCRTTGA